MVSEKQNTILMCAPTYFDVNYVINPWMTENLNNSNHAKAQLQWQALKSKIESYANVVEIQPVEGLPDLVFTANAGLVKGKTAIPANFKHGQRQGEKPYNIKWFEENGFEVKTLDSEINFEGAGDALFDRGANRLWAGFGFRTDLSSHKAISDLLDVEVISLKLVNPEFYHIDTCFCPLKGGYFLYHPAAFDRESNEKIESLIPEDKRFPVASMDASNFACNAVDLDEAVLFNKVSKELENVVSGWGFKVIQTDLSEFLKAGGSSKCLTLRVTE